MVAGLSAWWLWFIPTLFVAPWMAGIVMSWRQRPRDGAIPASMADEARRRLWPQ